MFTQSAPAIINALSGVLPDNAVRALVQALGNCQQPLTHRGDVNLAPREPANQRGVVGPGAWNPQQYQDLLPINFDQFFYEAPAIGSYTNGNWYSTNYAGAQFSFPTNQEFFANEYYGGPTFNVGGSTTFNNLYADNATHNTSNVTNLNVENINNIRVAQPPGSNVGDLQPGPAAPGAPSFTTNITNNFFSDEPTAGTQGVPTTRAVLANVDVVGKIRIPVVQSATLRSDCTIQLNEELIDLPVTINVYPVLTSLRYLRPSR